jgi:hypothetical protein
MVFNATFNNILAISCLMQPSLHTPYTQKWTVFVVIVVPVQSAPITTSVVSSNHAHSEAHRIQHYVIMLVSAVHSLLGDGVQRHFQQYFSHILTISFIGGGNGEKTTG